MENRSYPISLRVKMIRETEEFLEANLAVPKINQVDATAPEAADGAIEEAGTHWDDLDPAA